MTQRIVIDCAGAMVGGAARFLRELRAICVQQRNPDIELIGPWAAAHTTVVGAAVTAGGDSLQPGIAQ